MVGFIAGDPNADNEVDRIKWLCTNEETETFTIIRNEWVNHHSKKWLKNLNNKKVVIQAGGCFGMYPRLLSDKFDLVYTFEPSPESFACLVFNCPNFNVIKIQAALGDKPGLIDVFCVKNNRGMNFLTHTNNDWVPIMTIDSFKFPVVDVIALDTEGYEYKVLQGARKTIKKHHPRLILEGGEKDEIKEFLAPFGYKIMDKSAGDTIWI